MNYVVIKRFTAVKAFDIKNIKHVLVLLETFSLRNNLYRFSKIVPFLFSDNSAVVPPDPIPNSEVKRSSADGSVGSPHVRVGHRQALNYLVEM